MDKDQKPLEMKRSLKKRHLFIFSSIVVFSFLLFILGYSILRHEYKELKAENYDKLQIISNLQNTQISNWRKERIADVFLQSKQPYSISLS